MINVSDEVFAAMVGIAIDRLHAKFKDAKNVGVVIADEPTPEQRERLKLRGDQTLFGLYEGIPLTARNNGYSGVLPDKITIFKLPICMSVLDEHGLQEQIHRTLWHELAHHFGLNHQQIHERE
jgi:predicted Zn-dependent protease with MMP-like domain